MIKEQQSVILNTIAWLKNHPDPMVSAAGLQVEMCIRGAYDLVGALNSPSSSYYDSPNGGPPGESQQERFGK